MKQMYDVVVVGAGPCGSAAAGACAEAGMKTLCIEEHATIGYPVQCAGLLSTAAFAECRVGDAPVIWKVQGARMISDHGSELLFDARETKAVVVDRGRLDLEMAKSAADAGAEFRLKTSVTGISGNEVKTVGADGMEHIPFRMLIAADGPRNALARMHGMHRSPIYLSGVQAEMPYEMDGRYVELYPSASPDFFGWAIPSGDGRARIGLCGGHDVPERFSTFSRRFGSSCLHLVTGTIPLGVMPRTYGHRTLFVGDAAGFPKPTSGGGVYTGVRSARYAARVAARCCAEGDFGDSALSEYESLWKADFGRELKLGLHLLRLRQSLNPVQIDDLCQKLNDPRVIETVVRYGDMDRPSELVRRLCTQPALFRTLGALIRHEMGNIMNY